jgi:hypothetical protein
MPSRKQMMSALDDAFAEQMKTLFTYSLGAAMLQR